MEQALTPAGKDPAPRSPAAVPIAIALALAVLFFILNRGAYQSFFQDDDYDTLSWISDVPWQEWLIGLITPIISPRNFRPAGHAYYLLKDLVGFRFWPFLLVSQLAHVLNSALIWGICRKMGLGRYASLAGAGFFLLNMAAIEAFWKPMYSFDLLCTTFCLLSILLWASGRWILSFLAFWLAYKAKELAIMLPVALACYELWFGQRRHWWKLIPFFAVSLSFGLQAIVENRKLEGDYHIQFDPLVSLRLAGHYLERMALVPYAWYGLILVPLLVRDRRVWWGFASMCLFLFPLAMLPGRVFDCYTYLPLSCLAIAVGAIAGTKRPLAVPVCAAIFFTVWAARDLRQLRIDRNQNIAVGKESRAYFDQTVQYARTHTKPEAIIYAGFPSTFHNWGVSGLFSCAFSDLKLHALYIEDPRARDAMLGPSFIVVYWNPVARKTRFLVHAAGAPETSYVTMDENTPIWLLDDGWYALEGNYRWTKPHTTAHLSRPAGARELVVETNVLPAFAAKPRELRVSLDGAPLGTAKLNTVGLQTLRWPLKTGRTGMVELAFDVSEGFQTPGDDRLFGLPITSFGFR